MKQNILYFLFICAFSMSFALAQTQTSDPPGKFPGPIEDDHILTLKEKFSTLGRRIYERDSSCSEKNSRKIQSKDFDDSYSTLILYLGQKDSSLEASNDTSCQEKNRAVDKYFKCLLEGNEIKRFMREIILDLEAKPKTYKTKTDAELVVFFEKIINISESKP